MDDKYLDKVFREKLESPQNHGFNEAAWLDLESRLEDEPNRRIIPWRWIAAAGILLPMLLSSFYFYKELRHTEEKLTKLEIEMNNLSEQNTSKKHKTATNQSLAMNDVIVNQTEIIPQTSTTFVSPLKEDSNTKSNTTTSSNTLRYNQKSVNNTSPKENLNGRNHISNPTNENQRKENKDFGIDEDNQSMVFVSPLEKENNDNIADKAFYLGSKNEVTTKEIQFRKPTISDIDYLNYVTNNPIIIDNNNDIKNNENLWSRAVDFVVPIGYEISIGSFVGTQIPTTTPFVTIRETEPYFNNQGIKGALFFRNNVDLTLGVSLANYNHTTQTIGQDFPIVEPNNIGDAFIDVTVTEDIVQIPVGLKYLFGDREESVFAPFVEIGSIAKRSVQKRHRFEYLPELSTESYAILSKPQKISEGFTINTASVGGGVRWNPRAENRILDNIVIQAEAFVNADFETPDIDWSTGVGVSVSYMF